MSTPLCCDCCFDGKKTETHNKKGLDFGDEDAKAEFEPLAKLMKGILGDKVEKLTESGRIVVF